jgi:hypothetical protein
MAEMTPAKSKFLSELDNMEFVGMEKTKEWVSLWSESLRYFFSDQLSGNKRHKDWDWVIVNYIWPTAMQEMAKLTNTTFKAIGVAREESDVASAEAWQGAIQYLWDEKLEMRDRHAEAILDSKIFGYRVSKIMWDDMPDGSWDDEIKEWVGDVGYKLWHPAHFWVDPQAESINEAQSLGTVRVVTLEWAQQRWPKFKKELEEEARRFTADPMFNSFSRDDIRGSKEPASVGGKGDRDNFNRRERFGPQKLVGLILGQDKITKGSTPHEDQLFVKISEIYFIDREDSKEKLEVEIPAEELIANGSIRAEEGTFLDNETGEPIERVKWPKRVTKEWVQPKYPRGRFVIKAGDVILNPETKSTPDAQKYKYSRWPFTVTAHYLLPHMWQGIDSHVLGMEHQDFINISASHLLNNMKLYGDPKVAIETGALETNPRTKKHFKVGAGAGAIIRLAKNGLSKLKFVDPPQPSAAATQLYQLFVQEYKNTTGLQDASRGISGKSGETATARQIDSLNSNDRIRLQAMQEDRWAKNLMNLIAEIIQDKYSVGRFVRIIGDDGVQGAQEITSGLKKLKFDITIEPGKTLPFDKAERNENLQKAAELLSNPIANVLTPELLRAWEIPNWQKVLQRYEPWTQFAQFVQLLTAVQEGEIEPEEALRQLGERIAQAAPEPEESENRQGGG